MLFKTIVAEAIVNGIMIVMIKETVMIVVMIAETDIEKIVRQMLFPRYSGDPLALTPFVNAVKLVRSVCRNRHEVILKNVIMTKLKVSICTLTEFNANLY